MSKRWWLKIFEKKLHIQQKSLYPDCLWSMVRLGHRSLFPGKSACLSREMTLPDEQISTTASQSRRTTICMHIRGTLSFLKITDRSWTCFSSAVHNMSKVVKFYHNLLHILKTLWYWTLQDMYSHPFVCPVWWWRWHLQRIGCPQSFRTRRNLEATFKSQGEFHNRWKPSASRSIFLKVVLRLDLPFLIMAECVTPWKRASFGQDR